MRRLIFIVAALAMAGCLDLNHQQLGSPAAPAPPTAVPTPTPSGPPVTNGSWPTLTNFNKDILSNNAGGGGGNPNAAANDSQDGCGASASSASIASSTASEYDSTPYLRLTYNVATNAGCGYEYAAVAFPFVSQNLSGKTGISFDIRSSATVRIMVKTANVDPCLGAKNKMWYDIPSSSGAWQALTVPFASFTPKNAGCPYPQSDVASIDFEIDNVGSGTVDLDNIAFY
jgi:hypothetical protein